MIGLSYQPPFAVLLLQINFKSLKIAVVVPSFLPIFPNLVKLIYSTDHAQIN